MGLLLAETISGNTSVSVTLILALVTLVSGIAGTSIASRITHGLAIKQLREKDKETDARVAVLESKMADVELWRARRQGRDEVLEQSSVRGTQPYRSGK